MNRKITLVNHATILLELGTVRLLTDPVYSWTLGYYIPRLRKPGIAFELLPSLDLIVISHADYDHLNLNTLRRLRRKGQSRIVFPDGLAKYGRRTGFRDVVELKLWEATEGAGYRITCVPAQHKNKRLPWDTNRTLACGYVIEAEGSSVFFAGDSGYSSHFGEIGGRYALDVALLPIGAYKPADWFRNIHLNPETALQAFLDLKARHLVPIHWGTFKISDEPLREPPILLRKRGEEAGILDRIHVLQNGESFSW